MLRYTAGSRALQYSLKALQILCHGAIYFGEVKFYFLKMFGGEIQAFALVSLYSLPNKYLLQCSHATLAVCRYNGEGMLIVVDVKLILLVVAMVPFPFLVNGEGDQFFMIEKIGLDVIEADNLNDNK